MTDDLTFDWVALAPIEEVASQTEAVCVARGLSGLWYASAPGGISVKGCRITAEDGASLAVLTLQGYQSDQTHLRLQPVARASTPGQVAVLADTYPPHDSWLGGIEIGRRTGTFADAVG
jgi:hypothetical protein